MVLMIEDREEIDSCKDALDYLEGEGVRSVKL